MNKKNKLTENEVYVIKGLFANTSLKIAEVARIFGVNSTTMSYIKNGKTWKHIKLEEE